MTWSILPMLAAAAVAAQPAGPDTDGDGLSDFHEIHKHFTDPASPDSDGDGVPDGDWNERREFAYTVRSVLQVLRPVTPDVLCDDYQDARILDETDQHVEIEVVHYPLNTVASAVVPDPDWRKTVSAPEFEPWLRPGLTANWDEAMRREIEKLLEADGVDLAAIDDKTLVEVASRRVLQHAEYADGFSTFSTCFVDGKAGVYPGMEGPAASGEASSGMTIEEQWQRELFAKGMFENAARGSCTSSAIYVNGCLRALGIPTRIVLCVPVIDASDEREHGFVKRLRHHEVRRTIEEGTGHLGNSWASHTFNEVYVGGRWRRLNYDRLGQNTLDSGFFGLMTHVATFSDWADGNMAATWGLRQSRRDTVEDALGGSNPYSCVALSDRFGAHAQVENPAPSDYFELTIDAAYWFAEHPAGVDMRIDDPETAGHVVVRVEEGRAGEGPRQYKAFYEAVGKSFVLRAEGRPDVPLRATRGYWARPEEGLRHFYLRIEPDDFTLMEAGVPYTLAALNDAPDRRWVVRDGVTLTRAEGGAMADVATLTIDSVYWSDSPDSPTGPIDGMGEAVLLARVGPSGDFDAHKRFTEVADRRFFLEAEGHPTLKVGCGIGGITTERDSYIVIQLGPADWRDLVEGVDYTLRAQNSGQGHRWVLADGIRVRR